MNPRERHALRTLVNNLHGARVSGIYSLDAVALVDGWHIQRSRVPRLTYTLRYREKVVSDVDRADTEDYLRIYWLEDAILTTLCDPC